MIMTPEELKNEAQKKAQELIDAFGAVELGETEDGFTYTMNHDGIEEARQCALVTCKQMLEEHSCFTLNDTRWAFWAQVEIEVNEL
jgi:hypothetical protein